MFELSDDEDENFWNDIPLHNVNTDKSCYTENSLGVKKPQLRVPESSYRSGQPAKKLCTEKGFLRDPVEALNNSSGGYNSKENSAVTRTCHKSESISLVPECLPPKVPGTTNEMTPRQVTTHTPGSLNTKSRSLTEAQNTPNRSADGSVDYITPKRKRKFPGPAGVLPKLTPGQSLDIGMHVTTPEVLPKENKSPKEDMVILSSQSSENLFLDDPWQALLKDIGDEGLAIMRKFSIASTLLKAGKKQLHQGKAWLVFGIIESIENHGSEASASIKDKSGNMHGTIHTDLMTEYELELQVGTVLVLKQVSIISLSNKNHYLNITPNNLVSLYHIKENTLKSLHFHGSQDSLHSVLKALEKESTVRRHVSTPDSSVASSRLSMDRSGTSTPVLSAGTPDVQSLNKRLFNMHSPGNQLQIQTMAGVRNISAQSPGNQLQTMPGVRDVSVIHRQSSGNTHYANRTYNSPATQLNKQTINTSNAVNGNDANYSVNTGSQLITSLNNKTSQQTLTSNSGDDGRQNVSAKSKWKFRSPTSSEVSSPNPSVNTSHNSSMKNTVSLQSGCSFTNNKLSDSTGQSGRACQLQVTSGGLNRCNNVSSNMSTHSNSSVTNTTNMMKSSDNNDDHSDLWEDDLTDEMLSQMSDVLA